jgi:hypothetical protein
MTLSSGAPGRLTWPPHRICGPHPQAGPVTSPSRPWLPFAFAACSRLLSPDRGGSGGETRKLDRPGFTGTPSEAGTHVVAVEASDRLNAKSASTIAIVITAPPKKASASPPSRG